MEPSISAPRSAAVLPLLATALAGVAVALILMGLPIPAGAAVVAAAGALLLSGRPVLSVRVAFATAAVERVAVAAVLGAIAWVALPGRPVVAAGALVALSGSYLAAYLASKARGLGFPVEDRRPVRLAGWAVVSVGLLLPGVLAAALWAASALWLAVVAVEARQVFRHGEPA